MKSKRAYTTMNFWIRALAKEINSPIEQVKKYFAENMVFKNDIEEYMTAMAFNLEENIIKGKAMHVFMPDRAFCEWIVNCVSYLEPEHASVVQKFIGLGLIGCMHFPVQSQLSSFAFVVPEITWKSDGCLGPKHGTLFATFSHGNEQKLTTYSVVLKKEATCAPEILYYAKLIVGLGMYLSCFPDQLQPGIPDDLKHPNHFRNMQTRTIGISEKVIIRDGPIPHYRVGHFRFLQSDRYTYKKGQAVFVHGCFVKGKAETVLEIA